MAYRWRWFIHPAILIKINRNGSRTFVIQTHYRQCGLRRRTSVVSGRSSFRTKRAETGYTASQITYDLRRLRLKGLVFRAPRTNRYFVTPYGWKVARLLSRLDARVFRPAIAMFTADDAVLPFPLRSTLDQVDSQLDELIYQTFPSEKGILNATENLRHSLRCCLR